MLNDGQLNYLENLDSERADAPVQLGPYNPIAQIIADWVLKKTKELITDAEIEFMGASALGHPGSNDIDVYIFSDAESMARHIKQLEPLFGEPNKDGHKWKWEQYGLEVSLNVVDKNDPARMEKRKFFELLRDNKELSEEYTRLRMSYNGKTAKEYKIAKLEFMNKALEEYAERSD